MFLNSCCCGCSLPQGTKGIALYNFVRILLAFIPYTLMINRNGDVIEDTYYQKTNVYSLAILTMVSVLMLTFSLLLAVGAQRRKSSYLLPFLILDSLFIAGLIVSILSAFIYSPPFMFDTSPLMDDPVDPVVGSIIHAFVTALEIYFFLVVLSCHKQFEIEETEGRSAMADMKAPPTYAYDTLTSDLAYTEVPLNMPKPPPYPGLQD